MLITTLLINLLTVHIFPTSPIMFESTLGPVIRIPEFLIFNISKYEDKLIKFLPLYNSQYLYKEYNRFPGCIQAITRVVGFDDDKMFSFFIKIPALVYGVKQYSEFLNTFSSLKEKCVLSAKRSNPQLSIAKLTTDIIFNRTMLLKFIQIERQFMNYLTKFLYLASKGGSLINKYTKHLEFYKEYIETLYSVNYKSLTDLNTIRDYKSFIKTKEKEYLDMVILFLESLDIILYKNVINLFVLVFESVKSEDSIINNKTNINVREEFKEYKVHKFYFGKDKELNYVFNHLFKGLFDLIEVKVITQQLDIQNWEEILIKRTLKIITVFTLQLFESVAVFN